MSSENDEKRSFKMYNYERRISHQNEQIKMQETIVEKLEHQDEIINEQEQNINEQNKIRFPVVTSEGLNLRLAV